MSTKTEQRRQTISRGGKAGATLGERALKRAAIAEIRDLTNAPHTEHGAANGLEIQLRQAVAESLASETYKPPRDDSAIVIRQNATENDPRYVPLSLLLDDLRVAARHWTRGFTKDERQDLATDAALILMRWTRQGAEAPIYLGARGELPLRRDWLDPDKRTVIRDGMRSRPAPNKRAKHAMRMAIQQAARDRNSDSEIALAAAAAELETVSSDADATQETLASAALTRDQAKQDQAPILADTDQPELLADVMGITLTAARTIIARAWVMSVEQCRDQWGVSRSRAENILSSGGKELDKRYPEPHELIEALRVAVPAMRARLEDRAYTAIRDLASGWISGARGIARAEQAVNEWRAATGQLPMERRAIELAATRVGWMPENIGATEHLTRLMRAEQRRAAKNASQARSSHLGGKSVSPAKQDPAIDPKQVRGLTRAARTWSYGLEARTARQVSATDQALADVVARGRELADTLSRSY